MRHWARIKSCFSETFRTVFSPLTLFIWLTCIVVATISGPFGTHAFMDWYVRGAYWAAIVSVSIITGFSVRAFTLALVGSGRPLLFDLIAIGLMTVVFAPMVWAISKMSGMTYGGQVPSVSVFAGYVMICAAAVFVGRRIAPGFESEGYVFLSTDPEQRTAGAGEIQQPRLLRRLSEGARGDILRLTANDHFVDVVTVNGTETLRLRFTDAIDEMDPIEGYCVHRSHWVAREAIIRIERENAHKLFVVLANEDRIPVSRKYRSNLEDANLL